MRILVLTGKFGMGHISAAEAVKEELEKGRDDVTTDVVDLVEYLFPAWSKLIYSGFDLIAGKFNKLYNALNCVDGRSASMPLKAWFIERFQCLLDEHEPDILVSTWPVGSRYIGAYKNITGNEIPYITCITDISSHSEWISDSTNAYIAGDEISKSELSSKGVPAERIFVGGVPVRQAFKQEGKEKYGCAKEILIMGGGLGLIPGIEDMLEQIEKIEGLHTTVITGLNEKMREELTGKYLNTTVLGYTDNVAAFMKKADLIITKAGGITLFESIYTETPMLVIDPFMEQEKNNAAYIERHGIGKVMRRKNDDLTDTLREILDQNGEHEKMVRNMRAIKYKIEENNIRRVIEKIKISA
jgi:UDP-N-acetylglucosamine:LPS N-acetylglucosamine transferase